eukprot:c34795_g1_i1 orf=595-1572(+)
MERRSNSIPALILVLLPLSSIAGLSTDFYAKTCPNVASIVTQTVNSQATQSNVVPPSTLRLFIHDCLVQGCDASIMIASTPGNQAERDASDNLSLAGQAFNTIIAAKQAVEKQCPGVVSCADIISLAARDVVVFTGGPNWDVPLGRRDGLTSKASSVPGHLPSANANVAQLTQSIAEIGLSQADMVILSGAHTIGFSHCNQFTNRLYTFSSTQATDPSMNPTFAQSLKQQCPQAGGDPNTVSALDPTTSFTFDNAYFKNLQNGMGLLFSDEVLFTDPSTQTLVNQLAASQPFFFSSFVQAMINASSAGVLEGTAGEIRRDCSAFN